MRVKYIGMAVAGLLLAACGSTPEEIAELTSQGQGATAPAPVATPQVAALPTPKTGPTPGSPEEFVISVGDRVFFE